MKFRWLIRKHSLICIATLHTNRIWLNARDNNTERVCIYINKCKTLLGIKLLTTNKNQRFLRDTTHHFQPQLWQKLVSETTVRQTWANPSQSERLQKYISRFCDDLLKIHCPHTGNIKKSRIYETWRQSTALAVKWFYLSTGSCILY